MKSLKIDFVKENLGLYNSKRVKKVWNNPPRIMGSEEGRCSIVKLNDKKVLRVKFPKGTIQLEKSGAQWKLKFKDEEEIYIQYKIFFPKGFNFVRGGKLPGLHGGSSPTGGNNSSEGFSARIMWRTLGFANNTTKDPYKAYLCQYIYYPKKDSNWGKDFDWKYKNKRVYIKTGTWHTIKTRIKLNKSSKDLIESWFDGKKVLSLKLILRTKDYFYGIDSFNFVAMFGGNDKTWETKKTEYIYFDDFMISNKIIN